MKFLDANVFLRFIARPKTPQDMEFNRLANDLFTRAERGEEWFTTSEAVIAEVIYVLVSPDSYRFTREDAFESVGNLLALPGCRMTEKEQVIVALDTWRHSTKLSFVDALCMTKAEQHGHELVTFDTALAKAAGTQRWDLRSTDDVTNPTVETP